MLQLSLNRLRKLSTSSSDSDDEKSKKITAVPSNFTFKKTAPSQSEGLIMIDTNPYSEESDADLFVVSEDDKKKEKKESAEIEILADKQLQKILAQAKCGPAFEKNFGETAKLMGTRALKRKAKAENEKTAGKEWFNLPATELTDEARQDLELIQMRAALDPTRHYRRNDRTVLPKYFSIGHVVDAPEDYYSSRMTKKERGKTMVDELLKDLEFLDRSKAKYKELKAAEAKKRHGAFQRRGKPLKRKKDRDSGKVGKKGGKSGKKKHQ